MELQPLSQNSRLPLYLPYPRFLLTSSLSERSKLLYAVLLDRSTLSQRNDWTDNGGRIYVIFTVESIMKVLQVSRRTALKLLDELESVGLIERTRKGFSAPNQIYINIPMDNFQS